MREKIQEDNHNNAQILELINKIENIIKENYRNEDCNVIKDNNLLQKEVRIYSIFLYFLEVIMISQKIAFTILIAFVG